MKHYFQFYFTLFLCFWFSVATVKAVDIKTMLFTDSIDLVNALSARSIHKGLVLPTTCTYGSVTWKFTPSMPTGKGKLSYNNGTFKVTMRDKKPTRVGSLQATINYSGKSYSLYSKPLVISVAADDDAYGYLYCHMPNMVPEAGKGTLVSQCITYALGNKDNNGLVYSEMNRGSSVIPGIGTSLPWCRDAFLTKDTLRHCYYIVTTDLFGSKDNGTSMLLNYSIGMFKSYDLVNWTYSRCDIKKYMEQTPADNIFDNTGTMLFTHNKVSRVWAPQIIMINGSVYIYYAIGNTDNGENDHFYLSKANGDFTGIESIQMLYGANTKANVLDADINFLDTDSLYHMSYRDYNAGDIRDITTKDLLNPVWSSTPVTTYTDGSGFEAPSVFRRINDDVWNLGNVNFSSRVGYHFHTANACLRDIQPANDLSGHISPQHGSFLHVNETEYKLIQTWSDIKALITDATALNAKQQSSVLLSLIEKSAADISIKHTTTTDLAIYLALLQKDLANLYARYRYENALYKANYAILSDLPALKGKMDKIFNKEKLSVEIDAAQLIYSTNIISKLLKMAKRLETSTLEYYKILKSVGKPVSVPNGTFTTNNDGLMNASKAVSLSNREGVCEFFSAKKTDCGVSFTQTINSLPNGYYLIKCQAFERNGDNDYSGRDFSNGVELINYSVVGNDRSTKVKSIYSVSYNGTNSLNGFANGITAANTLFSANAENFANYLLVYVSEGKLTIGIQRSSGTVSSTSDWTCLDNFELYSLGN
ncbi:MAG: hypothetical protein PHR83_02045 [Paludibacter sp.]|nr:hypothetical protein [Paludibacter sp.]